MVLESAIAPYKRLSSRTAVESNLHGDFDRLYFPTGIGGPDRRVLHQPVECKVTAPESRA